MSNGETIPTITIPVTKYDELKRVYALYDGEKLDNMVYSNNTTYSDAVATPVYEPAPDGPYRYKPPKLNDGLFSYWSDPD